MPTSRRTGWSAMRVKSVDPERSDHYLHSGTSHTCFCLQHTPHTVPPGVSLLLACWLRRPPFCRGERRYRSPPQQTAHAGRRFSPWPHATSSHRIDAADRPATFERHLDQLLGKLLGVLAEDGYRTHFAATLFRHGHVCERSARNVCDLRTRALLLDRSGKFLIGPARDIRDGSGNDGNRLGLRHCCLMYLQAS